MSVRGSGIRTGGTLEDMAVDALCETAKATDKMRVAVDQMRQTQGSAQTCVESGNAKLDQIINLLSVIAQQLAAQETLVQRQEDAARELSTELRQGRGEGSRL